MSLTPEQVSRVASLARIRISPEQTTHLGNEINNILHWIDQLQQVDTNGVENYCDYNQVSMPERADVVCDGNIVEAVLKNAPESAHNMFAVPKVVE